MGSSFSRTPEPGATVSGFLAVRSLSILIVALVWAPCMAGAQPVAPPPTGLSAAEAEIWPFPAPDPKSWWTDPRPKPDEAADPLGGRRAFRGEKPAAIDNGVDPATYRLWGLTPLQWQLVRGDEQIVELWVRPSLTVRQAVVRVVVRRDGKAFVEARAGLACCEAGIARRMGFDAELPAGSAQAILALLHHPLWAAPRGVRVMEGGAAGAVCLNGTAYDLTLVIAGRSRSVRRACDDAEIGQAADVLEAVIGATLGHDPRFDVIFAGGAEFSAQRRAYEALLKGGGVLTPDPEARAQPPEAPPFDPAP